MGFVQLTTIDGGDAGVLRTLVAMRQLIDAGVSDALVIDTARRLAASVGTRNPVIVASQLRSWLSVVWRFVDDPADRELLRAPGVMLDELQDMAVVTGDCDEVAVLGGALAKAVGLQVALVAVAFVQSDGTAGRYEHVYATATTANGVTVDLDVTKPKYRAIPPVAATLVLDV